MPSPDGPLQLFLGREQTSRFRLVAQRNGQSVNETVSEEVLRPLVRVIADLHVPVHCLNLKKSKGLGNVFAERVV